LGGGGGAEGEELVEEGGEGLGSVQGKEREREREKENSEEGSSSGKGTRESGKGKGKKKPGHGQTLQRNQACITCRSRKVK
jgi:hypothetical protein